MRTLYSIQYLRGFAALAVVIFHAAERSGLHFAIGAAGVDIFFVVSGFIMMTISDARPTSPSRFLRDRLLRIAPAYWVATMVMLAGASVGLFPNLKLDVKHVIASLLFLPVPSPSSGELWPLLVQGWTLNYEIFFYAVFALTLLLPRRSRLSALAVVFGSLVALGLAIQPAAPLATFYTSPLILEFLAGAALAKLWAVDRLPSPAAGIGLVAASIAGFAATHGYGLEFDAWTCGPLALILVLGSLSIERGGYLPEVRSITYLGDSSYSIYLWHTFAISVVVKAGAMLALPPILTVLIGIMLGIVVGIAGYEMLEKPVQALLRKRRPAPAAIAPAG
jgi:exopolysaccharide production protein ExoZ